MPSAIGLMLISLLCSFIIIAIGKVNTSFYHHVESTVRSINFSRTLLTIMLGFLLFAGALNIDLKELKKQRIPVFSFSTISVALSIFLFGSLMWLVFNLFNYAVEYIHCLLFGALVSPTDPIAVIGILKKSNMSKEIETTINSESLFNDGVGVVFFVTISEVISFGAQNVSVTDVLFLFLREVIGGLALGFALGYAAFYFIRKINHYQTEVLLSLALVMISGTISQLFHVSGPLAVIVIGLILGNKIPNAAMSDITQDYHNKFWELIEDFLNAFLFVLIGLQMVLLPFITNYILIGFFAIFLLLVCRFVSLSIPILFFKNKKLYNSRTALVLTWGGLRGGLSIALTLSLPNSAYKEIIVSITYIIVIFSILVQGLTTGKLVKRLYKE